MEKQIQEVSYAEYIKLLTDEEHELLIILQTHNIMPMSAHELMSLNKILKKFYNNECIYVDQIVKSLNDCQKESCEKLKILRM